MFMTNIVSISAPFLQYKRSPSTKGTIFLHQDEKFRLCQPYLLHYHHDRPHPPQQGLPHIHHHLHHYGDGCLPFTNSSQSSFSGDGIAASKERMLYHPNVWPKFDPWVCNAHCASITFSPPSKQSANWIIISGQSSVAAGHRSIFKPFYPRQCNFKWSDLFQL